MVRYQSPREGVREILEVGRAVPQQTEVNTLFLSRSHKWRTRPVCDTEPSAAWSASLMWQTSNPESRLREQRLRAAFAFIIERFSPPARPLNGDLACNYRDRSRV